MQMNGDFTCLESCNSILEQMKSYGDPIVLITQISSKNVASFTLGLEEKPDFQKIYKGWQKLGKISVKYNVHCVICCVIDSNIADPPNMEENESAN